NALVGLARPGKWGSDVSHLNLHKTFCIPHGGGGPGVGPCAEKAHLAPVLPRGYSPSSLPPQAGEGASGADGDRPSAVGMVSAAAHGSASTLPISGRCVEVMGGERLRKATQVALLIASYFAPGLGPHYRTLYTGRGGRVAQQCIRD